ncbi:spermidine synthase [Halobacteriales archaeon QS_5_70_15]|nr:MAG: spermidine synthase [Halobacteriales archaeon QS_5_70_15]
MDGSPLDWRPTGIELAVLVSGVASMGLEILAGRLLAPEFGSSIFTWGSVIGVFLGALSLGYYRGGRRARQATRSDLATLLLYSAGYVAFLLLAGDLVLRATGSFPVPARFAPLFPVTILFGPPVYLLGFISPYAAELSDRENTGEASGHVYALGTVGSIAGAFLTTFLLVPSLPVRTVGILFGVLLVAASAGLSLPSLSRERLTQIGVVLLVLVGVVLTGPLGAAVVGETVYRTQTPYQSLEVVDSDGVRTLYLDDQPHSAMDLEDPDRHVFDYTRYFHIPLLLSEDVDRVLFIGGGGFTGPKHFERMGMTVDVVEIDPVVVRAAKEYFRVEESANLRIHTADGRQFMEETDRTYDLIVLDAYKRDKVPFQLTTVEFMRLAADRLDEDGVLLANVISAPGGPASKFYRAEYRTMSRVFPQAYAFPTSETGLVQNIEIVATKDSTRVTEAELRRRAATRDVGANLSRAVSFYRADVRTDDVPVLRDGHAPVERLLDPMAGKAYVVEGSNGTSATTGADLRGAVGRPAVAG